MAKETAAELWVGTDFQWEFSVLNEAETAAINIAGWALSFMVKKRLSYADSAAIITKTTAAGGISITGTYNADPDVNTQVATVTVTDDDSDGESAGVYYYELKRTDAGFETILAYGELELKQSVHRT